MATNKANIFNSLSQHHSDSEGEDTQQNTRVKRTNEKRDPKSDNKNKNKNAASAGDNLAQKANKEEHSRHKDARPQKGVTGEPHPLDRHSGTGHPAYGGKPKKGGSGKGNWGSERRNVEARGDEEREGVEENTEEKVEEEQKPELTLQEYYQRRGITQNEPQINEAKAKITSDQLYKEMGTATLLKTRHHQQVDDHKVGKKKDRLDVDHHAGITTEHASLLNFRTGFVEKEYKQRGQDEAGSRRFGEKPEGARPKKIEAKEETQPTAEAGETQPEAEGQQPTTEETTAAAEGQRTQNRRRPEGQRGNGRGVNRDRPQGGRKPYGGKSEQIKVDFADESAFPKLG